MHALMALLIVASLRPAHQEVIDDILESLSKGVNFFEQQSRNMNLDGVVGYVILQAQLQQATKSQTHSDSLNLSQRSITVSLVKKLDKSLALAVAALQQTDPKYYKEFEPVLSASFWSLPNEWISTDLSLAYSTPRSVECYDEQLGDKCMTLLLGTWKDDGTPCIVTKACRDTMTRFGCPHYSLSHQLLYFMIGTMKGCARMLKGELRLSRVNITVEHYQKIFCSNMMKSNQEMSIKGLTWQIQDIFMENILLCGLAGFSDFYKAAWLQHILAWQDKDLGCFGKDDDYSQMFEEFLDAAHKRVKRREKTLKDGCSSHTTGVAMSALGGYINFYLSEQDITKRPLV
ncbi:UPF0764 protein C16orf89 homolog [Silurus meridionalis]|uniref:Uncharacterized protein n=1 Tax=Silurus meridionalis TaxID=175797 RepID=A0A8T0B0U4_SILME|nr:UPF0764 protein C16orf89 homolog [Silurus meridionalis]KAF7698444.1 hypothetical protein HF521_004954 [Silurus meridionalis]